MQRDEILVWGPPLPLTTEEEAYEAARVARLREARIREETYAALQRLRTANLRTVPSAQLVRLVIARQRAVEQLHRARMHVVYAAVASAVLALCAAYLAAAL